MPIGKWMEEQKAKTQDRFDRKMLKAGVMSDKEYDKKRKERAKKKKKLKPKKKSSSWLWG